MPLRSVEAATRDDAIAAAREQFGPQVRVVGVRRVRSGGVLGFFATERYVAEVAPDVARPPLSSPSGGMGDGDELGPSPLASAAPATAAPAPGPSRAGAPARNGAAVYAAEALRSGTAGAAEPAQPAARPATRAAARSLGWAAESSPAAPVAGPPAGNPWAGDQSGPVASVDEARPTTRPWPAPRTGGVQKAAFAKAVRTAVPDDDVPDEPQGFGVPASAAPSPFTAALARMVAGDAHVRQAVENAVEEAADRVSDVPSRDGGGRPVRATPAPRAETAVWPGAARQEEETVGNQVSAPPSEPVDTVERVEVPTWAAGPDLAVAPDPTREEAIAEVLRSALAQGHSDEALAGILRTVLDGASPQVALSQPKPAPAASELPDVAGASGGPVAAEPAAAEPLIEQPLTAEPLTAEGPVEVLDLAAPSTPDRAAAAVTEEIPVGDPVEDRTPATPAPDLAAPGEVAEPAAVSGAGAAAEPAAPDRPVSWSAPLPAVDIWAATPASTLWGQSASDALRTSADAPIWAEVLLGEQAHDIPLVDGPIAEQSIAAESVAADSVAAVPEADGGAECSDEGLEGTAGEAAPDAAPVEAIEAADVAVAPDVAPDVAPEAAEAPDVAAEAEVAAEVAEVAEVAPMLARTASDPAPSGLPLSMSLDATSVMPPLSLLPPLPSSRGRGKPPVPPMTPRGSRSSRAAAAEAPLAPELEVRAPAEPARSAATAFLATVTRLPVALPPIDAGTHDRVEQLTPPEEPVAEPDVEQPVTARQPEWTPAAQDPVAEAPAVHLESGDVLPVAERSDDAQKPPASPVPASAAKAPVELHGDVTAGLTALGLPPRLLGDGFAVDVERHGTYAALTRALGLRLPAAPILPTGAGEVLFVVGPGVETLRAARSLAASLCLDPDRVQWATPGDLAGLAPESSRMTTLDAAISRRHDASGAGTVTIVAVDAPMRADAYWMTQMLAIWSPVAVWAVVEATRKPEDVEPWLDSLARVDALIVQDTDLSTDPAAVLHRVAAPVAVLDGVRATPHRWASLLCERLEGASG